MTNLFNYRRRPTIDVRVGNITLGSRHPIAIQSMTTTPTDDTEASAAQAKRIIDAGGDIVRLTTQGIREAENLKNIQSMLRRDGYLTPLVADVHFNPKVADVAALYAEKVRINPGNYVDAARKFAHIEYTDSEYADELKKIEERFVPFINICKANGTAIRIGVNHGSLSDRIMSRYGDTPEGIVESCMEFLRVCHREHFTDVVISIKASNTVVMVQSVRLLVERMETENIHFPLHLGVTEAGEGEDGRIKSAVGIGALLTDGIGDTIRVSLSEEPEHEIPVARHLAEHFERRTSGQRIVAQAATDFSFINPRRRTTVAVDAIGGEHVPAVILSASTLTTNEQPDADADIRADYLYCGSSIPAHVGTAIPLIADYGVCKRLQTTHPGHRILPLFTTRTMRFVATSDAKVKFLLIESRRHRNRYNACLKAHPEVVAVYASRHDNRAGDQRAFVHGLMNDGITNPVIFANTYHHTAATKSDFQIEAAADAGVLCMDGMTDGLWLINDAPEDPDAHRVSRKEAPPLPYALLAATALGILQAARLRTSKTEYISCPGCGRTLYDLQTTIARIKAATKDMKGLKIGIMGCIVNGPGEMADADYGYVGAGRGRISLYRKQVCVERNIPEEEAVEKLLALIRSDRNEQP